MPSQLEHHESAPFDIAGTGLPMRDHPNPFSASAPASQPSPSKLKVKPIFVKGQPPNLTTFKVHVMETFSYAKEKELRTLIRRHGGETEPHFAKADIVILDISNPIKGRKLYREARTLERPIPVVTAKWVYESSQKGEMADYTDPTFDPTVVLDKNGSLVKPTSSAASPISSSSIGRNPYTAEDRAFIVAHLARTRKPWSILSIAKQLASLRPDHTWQSYQTFLSSNLKHKWNLAQEVERYLKKPPAEGAPTPSAAPKLDVSENSSRGSIQNRIQAGSPSIGDGEEPSDVCNSSTKHVEPDGDGKSETNQEHKVDEARSDERNASSAAGKDGQGQNASQRLDGHVSGSGIEVREGTHADENQRGGEELEGENRKQAEGRGYMPEKKNGPVMDKGSETDARLISASSEHQGENSDDAAVEKQVIQENETAVDGCSDPEARAKVLEDPNHGKGLVDDNIQAGEPTDVTSGETERDPSDEAGERQHRNEMVGDERDELAPGESEEERGEDEDEDEDEEDELEIKAPRPAPTVTNSTFAAANASKETYHTEADNRFDGPSQVDHLASHEQGRAASTESRLDETSSKTQRTGPGRSAGEIPLHADGNEMVRVPGVSSPPPLEESEPEDGWGEGDEDLEESSSPEQARVVTSKSGDKDGNRNRHASPEGVLPTKSGDIRPVKRRSRRSQKSKKPEYDSDSSWNGRERRRLAAKASKEAGDQGKRAKFLEGERMMLLKELSELLGRWDGNGQDPTSNPSDEFWEFMHQQCGRHSAPSWKSHFNKNREIYIEAANIHAKAEEPTQPVEEERGDEVGEGNEVEDSQALRGDLQDDVVTVEIQQRSSENDGEESSSENEEEEEPNSYSRMAEGLDETREELDELGEAQGLEDLASEQVRRMSQPSPELVLERSATGDPAGSRQDQEVDKAPIENDDSSPDLSSKEAAEVEDAVLGPRFSTPQPTSTKPLPTSQHPIGSVDESLGQAPQLAMRKEHHDAKVAAKEDAKRSSRIVDDVLLSPTLGLAAASPARNPSFAAVVARSEIRSEARVTDKSRLEALFPSQPAFLERKAATGMIAPTSSSKPPGGASKEYAEAAVGPSQPSLGNDRRTVHRDSKRQPRMSVPLPVTRRVVSPTEAEQSVPTRSSTILRRKAGRQTISGAEVSLYEKHSRVHKGTPLIPRHRSAAFYDFSIDEGSTDEPEDEKFFVQVPTRGQASSSSKGKGRGPSHWDTDSDEGMGERYRAKRRAPAAAFGSLTSSSSPAKSVGRSMSLALKTEQALGGNGPSSKPVERKPSSSRKGLSDPTKSPKGPTRPRTTTTSARPSLLPPDDALTLAKAKYQASVLELCSDFGLKTPAQAARFLKEVDGDVRSGRRMIEQHVQRIAEEFQVSTKMVIEFVRAADGKWDEAKKFLAVFSHQEREAEEEEEEERTRKRSTSNPVQIQNRTKRSNPPDQDSSLPRVSGQGWRKRPSKQIRLG